MACSTEESNSKMLMRNVQNNQSIRRGGTLKERVKLCITTGLARVRLDNNKQREKQYENQLT